MLLGELAALLEAGDLEAQVRQAATAATKLPISFRGGGGRELYVVINGEKRGEQGADDHELAAILKRIEAAVESAEHPVERLYAKNDDERPNGLQIGTKAGGKKAPDFKVRLIKKSIPRPASDGDVTAERAAFEIDPASGAHEANERHFVKLFNAALERAGGSVKLLTLDGHNDRKLEVANVTSAKWVKNKGGRVNALLFDEDGKVTRLGILPRNFTDLGVGASFLASSKESIIRRLDQAVDNAQVELGDEGFSEKKHLEVAAKLTKTEAHDVYFGGPGDVDAVLIETFLARDLKLDGSSLTVSCDYVLKALGDLHDRLWPYLTLDGRLEDHPLRVRMQDKVSLGIVPRFRLQPHARRSTRYPKTLLVK